MAILTSQPGQLIYVRYYDSILGLTKGSASLFQVAEKEYVISPESKLSLTCYGPYKMHLIPENSISIQFPKIEITTQDNAKISVSYDVTIKPMILEKVLIQNVLGDTALELYNSNKEEFIKMHSLKYTYLSESKKFIKTYINDNTPEKFIRNEIKGILYSSLSSHSFFFINWFELKPDDDAYKSLLTYTKLLKKDYDPLGNKNSQTANSNLNIPNEIEILSTIENVLENIKDGNNLFSLISAKVKENLVEHNFELKDLKMSIDFKQDDLDFEIPAHQPILIWKKLFDYNRTFIKEREEFMKTILLKTENQYVEKTNQIKKESKEFLMIHQESMARLDQEYKHKFSSLEKEYNDLDAALDKKYELKEKVLIRTYEEQNKTSLLIHNEKLQQFNIRENKLKDDLEASIVTQRREFEVSTFKDQKIILDLKVKETEEEIERELEMSRINKKKEIEIINNNIEILEEQKKVPQNVEEIPYKYEELVELHSIHHEKTIEIKRLEIKNEQLKTDRIIKEVENFSEVLTHNLLRQNKLDEFSFKISKEVLEREILIAYSELDFEQRQKLIALIGDKLSEMAKSGMNLNPDIKILSTNQNGQFENLLSNISTSLFKASPFASILKDYLKNLSSKTDINHESGSKQINETDNNKNADLNSSKEGLIDLP